LQAVGRMRVDHHLETLPGVADRGEAVGVRALAGDETELRPGGFKRRIAAEVETAARAQLVTEERLEVRRIAAEQIESEGVEVARLADVHRRAGSLVRIGAGAHAVDPGAEELVEHVVLVRREYQRVDRKTHRAGNVSGADVAEVARGHREADALLVRGRSLEI